jgi:hypothetical protein
LLEIKYNLPANVAHEGTAVAARDLVAAVLENENLYLLNMRPSHHFQNTQGNELNIIIII